MGILWFLWYALVLAYIGPPILAAIGRRLSAEKRARAERATSFALVSRTAPLWLGLLGFPFMAMMYGIELSTPIAVWLPFPFALLLPEAQILGFYFLYFSVGWLLLARPEWLQAAEHLWFWRLLLGVGAFSFAIVYSNHFDAFMHTGYWSIRFISQYAYSVATAGFTLGILGAFLRFQNRPSRAAHFLPATRFLMDASFWVYLVHIPTVVIFQALIVPLE